MSQSPDLHIIFRFFLAALAAWRLAFLIAREDGPWRLFARLRERLTPGILGELFSCVKCLGFWFSIPFAFFVGGNWVELVIIWLALSGVTALIDEWTRPPFEWKEDEGDELLRTGTDSSTD
jgi:hypothetical protein